MPAVSVMSLIATGRPWSGPSRSFFATALSASRAASRACSAASVTMALSFGLIFSITARCASSTSTGLTTRSRISRANSRADLRVRLMSAMECDLLAGPVYEAPLDHEEQQIEAIAEHAGGEYSRIHAGHVEQLLRLEHAVAETVLRADEHFGDHDDDERQRDTVAQADEGLRQRFQQHDVEQYAQPRRPHDLCRQQPGLARVHYAVSDVEQDHQNGAKRGDRYLGFVADAEQHQEQRKHGGCRRRAKEIDDEFERAIEPFRVPEHDAERNGDNGGDGGRRRGPVNRLDEVEAERAAVHAEPQRLEGRQRRRQQHGIDPAQPCRQRPDGEEADNTEHRQEGFQCFRPHARLTSRWNTSRQCALVRTNSGSDKVASVRGRAAATTVKSATRAGCRDNSSTRSARNTASSRSCETSTVVVPVSMKMRCSCSRMNSVIS